MNIPVSILNGIKDNIQLSEIIGEKVKLLKKGKSIRDFVPFMMIRTHPSLWMIRKHASGAGDAVNQGCF
jgi:hypothetical protein